MLRTIAVELHKWRRTSFLLVTVAAALAGPLLIGLTFVARDGIPAYGDVLEQTVGFFLLLTGPLITTLIGAQSIAAEYQWDTWKVSLTAPVPRWTVYVTKWLVGTAWIVGLSLLAGLTGLIDCLLMGATGEADLLLWVRVFSMGGLGLSALLPLYHAVTLVTRSFFVTSGVGIVTTFAAILAINSKYQLLYPISGNLVLTTMQINSELPPRVLGSLPIWIGIQVGLALVFFLVSLVYVQRADYR